MKRTICILLTVLMLVLAVPLSFGASDVVIDAERAILIPAAPTDYERFAAEKLCEMLGDVFGCAPEITTEANDHYIALGAVSSADVGGMKANGYRIRAIDGNIHINGNGTRGLQIAVYRFMETFAGRKIYTSALTRVEQRSQFFVPKDTDLIYEPFFECTDTDWNSPLDTEYSLANGLTCGERRTIPKAAGGTVDYLGGFCHTVGALCELQQHKDSDPTFLALHDGVRTTDQPCLTNPKVLETATRNVLKLLEKEHDPGASLQIVSVTQNDNFSYCECDDCRAFEMAHGSVQSATMLNFVNQIADAVSKKGYDNVAVDTFAYQYTRSVPTGIVPRNNVIVRLCSIECCFTHTLDCKTCSKNRAFIKDLQDWSKICDRLYVWDYATNYSHTLCYFPNFGVIQRNIQVFYENNVKGVYTEGNYYMDRCNTEFGELRAYLISKCLQNPYCDYDEEMNGFLRAYYGDGWRAVRRFIDTTSAFGKINHMCIGTGPSWYLIMDPATAAVCDGYWAYAKRHAGSEEALAHLARSEISWRYWKADVGYGEFAGMWLGKAARQQLHDDILASGATQAREGYGITFIDDYMYHPTRYWFGASLNAFDDFVLTVRRWLLHLF
ncbi:MAG: DUF4838 domain-containing protein [Clostridia bacterium]|nr:DUF4838 domain-containing protein [Clostridia bacterium]